MSGRLEPPRLARRLLERALPEDIRESVSGDLEEVYRRRCDQSGPARAGLWYWWETASFSVRFFGERALERMRPSADPAKGNGHEGRNPPRGRTGMLHDLPGDVRCAIRGLLKSPQFTAAAVLILGLGIGANTAIFSVVDAVYFDDAPHVSDPDELVGVYATSRFSEAGSLQYADFAYYQQSQEAFDGLMGYGSSPMDLAIGRAGARSDGRGTFVSYNYFDVLGTTPALGRWFLPEEDQSEGTHLVAVISHGLWTRMFGSDPSVLGETIELNGHPFTVVGVAPEGFRGTSPLENPPDVWFPFHTQPVLSPGPFDGGSMLERMEHGLITWVYGIGRLREGVSVEAAQDNMDGLALYLRETYPESTAGEVRVYPDARFHPTSASSLGTMTRLLLAAVAALLLIASANVAILLLARGSARSRDMAVRVAVGAARGRVIRAVLTESVVLALLGATLGVGLAYLTSGLVAGLLPATFSVSFEPDATVLAFACALSLATALLFGLVPALQTGRVDVNRTLKGNEAGFDRSKLRGGLVVTQVAVAVSLAAAAALLGQSFATASAVPLGYEVEDRILLSATLSDYGYSEESGLAFIRQALEQLRAVPGVRSASIQTVIPFQGNMMTGITPPGEPESQNLLRVQQNSVGPEFFATMGIDIIAGRAIDETDVADRPAVVVVSATTARNLWPAQDPIGQTLLRRGGEFLWEVVGVAEDTRVSSLGSSPELYGYTAHSQSYSARVTFVVRGNAGAGPLRDALHSLNAAMAISEIETMRDVVGQEVSRFRTAALLVGVFGSLAVVLAMVGLYGVLSYNVVRARKDIGIRVALGASSQRVGRTVVGRALRLTTLGSLIGGLLAFAGAPLLASFLFGIGPRDSSMWAVTVVMVFLVAAAASLGPTLRAARVDPMVALRAE